MKRKLITMATLLTSAALMVGFNYHGQNHESVEKVSAVNEERNIASRSVRSTRPIAYGSSGTIYLELETEAWTSDNTKIVLYLYDGDVKNGVWGDFVVPSDTSRFVEYSFNVGFTPSYCYAFSVKSTVAGPDNSWINTRTSDDIISTTDAIEFNHVVWLGEYEEGKQAYSDSYSLDVSVKGGTTDDWQDDIINAPLTNVTINSSGELEISGNADLSGSVELPIERYFCVYCDSLFETFTAHPSISSNFEVSEKGNIHASEYGVFKFYFVYDYFNSYGESYITTDALETADEFGKSFLTKTTGYCSNAISNEIQTALGNEYYNLDDIVAGAQEAFYSSEVKRGKDLEYSCPASEALSRYVNMQEAKEYTDFLGLGANNPISSSPLIGFESRNYGAIIVIILSTTATITALGTLILLKKRKQF